MQKQKIQIRRQAFKYELRLNGSQTHTIRCVAGCKRWVYNEGLKVQNALYEAGKKVLNYAELCKLLTIWRHTPDKPWIAEAPVHTQQQGLKDLVRAWENYFAKRAGRPRAKKLGVRDRFRYPAPEQIKLEEDNSRIFLPKLGWLRFTNSRKVEGAMRNVTVFRKADK